MLKNVLTFITYDFWTNPLYYIIFGLSYIGLGLIIGNILKSILINISKL